MNETQFNYKNLDAYKEAKQLVMSVYILLKKFPREEQFALCDQLRRAVISVPSNIAEGSGRFSVKEQIHFLEIAYGSLREVECQLDIACDLHYITEEELTEVSTRVNRVAALLSGLRNHHLSLIPNP